MSRRRFAISTVITGLACAATAGVSLSASSAVGSPSTQRVVDVYSFVRNSSQVYTVAPDESVRGEALCPTTDLAKHPNERPTEAIGGGYHIAGQIGVSIASATASYPVNDYNHELWRVVVSNPKAAAGPVEFRVRVVCLAVETTR